MKTYEGQLVAGDEKFCIIISRFNGEWQDFALPFISPSRCNTKKMP